MFSGIERGSRGALVSKGSAAGGLGNRRSARGANHLKTARVLLRAIQSEKIRAELTAESPVLTDQDAAS
ncbi:hypothetical protein LMTR3_29175 [Bradyrhizobium sp. LMTR 3]|nr:hypothetical protein LMTR3_29175 [Bradyrhizobium sp. LMTR 3]